VPQPRKSIIIWTFNSVNNQTIWLYFLGYPVQLKAMIYYLTDMADKLL